MLHCINKSGAFQSVYPIKACMLIAWTDGPLSIIIMPSNKRIPSP